MRRHTLLILALAWAGQAQANTHPLSLYTSMSYAPLTGYAQIPAGGQFGTTSFKRPSFKELNLSHGLLYKLGVEYDSGWLETYGELQHMKTTQTAVLDHALVTHAVSIPAFTAVQADLRLNYYAVGIRHPLSITDRLTIAPELEVGALNSFYQITTPSITTSRHFTAITQRTGVKMKYLLTPQSYLTLDALTSLPKVTNLQVRSVNADYNVVIANDHHLRTTVFAGVGYENVHFKDKQIMPNDLTVKMSPMFELGIKVSF